MYEVLVVWETIDTGPDQPAHIRDYAEVWRSADKVVYSTSLESVSSERTRLVRAFDADDVRQLKATAKRDISVGGPALASHALRAGLVDECHLFVSPVLVGGGTPVFHGAPFSDLDLAGQRRFGNGVVHLHYEIRRRDDGSSG